MINNKYLLFGLIILFLDGLWLNYHMVNEYVVLFSKLNIKLSFNKFAAMIAYLLLILGYPLLIEDKNKFLEEKKAIIFGGLTYGIYGFTLAAIMPDYSIFFALKETIWGMTLYYLSIKILNTLKYHI